MNKKRDVVLGLDVSTSVVGIAFLTQAGDLVHIDVIDLRKVKGMMRKGDTVLEELSLFLEHFNVIKIYVEQNLSSFRPGFSSAGTLMTLARFNGIVSWIARSIFHVDPEYVNFTHARKVLGIKTLTKKKCGVDPKHQIWEHVSKMVSWNWKYKQLKSGPRKGATIVDATQYDAADAYVVAKAAIMNPLDCATKA